jgi:hypothetical protein
MNELALASEELTKQIYLLPVVGNPDQVEWLLLLILKKSCKVFTGQRLTFSHKLRNVSYATSD